MNLEYVWSRPAQGPLVRGLATGLAARTAVRSERVEVLGPVTYEPGMVRVRRADGSVVRALRENVRPWSSA